MFVQEICGQTKGKLSKKKVELSKALNEVAKKGI
jgi:hypothetical protein